MIDATKLEKPFAQNPHFMNEYIHMFFFLNKHYLYQTQFKLFFIDITYKEKCKIAIYIIFRRKNTSRPKLI